MKTKRYEMSEVDSKIRLHNIDTYKDAVWYSVLGCFTSPGKLNEFLKNKNGCGTSWEFVRECMKNADHLREKARDCIGGSAPWASASDVPLSVVFDLKRASYHAHRAWMNDSENKIMLNEMVSELKAMPKNPSRASSILEAVQKLRDDANAILEMVKGQS